MKPVERSPADALVFEEPLRGAPGVGAELTRSIPWLRVFVEGVVIVGKLEN